MAVDVGNSSLLRLERPLVLLGLGAGRRVVEAGRRLAVARLVRRVLELYVDLARRVDVPVAVGLADHALPLLDLVLGHVAQLYPVGPGLGVVVKPVAGPPIPLAEGGGADPRSGLHVGGAAANVVFDDGGVVVDVGLVAGPGYLDNELGHGHFDVELDDVCKWMELHVSVIKCQYIMLT